MPRPSDIILALALSGLLPVVLTVLFDFLNWGM